MWKLSCVDGVASHEVTSGSSGDTADQQSYSESLGIQPSEGGKMGAASRWRKCSQPRRRTQIAGSSWMRNILLAERKGHGRQKEQHSKGTEAPIIEPCVERDGRDGGRKGQTSFPVHTWPHRGQGSWVSGWAVGEPMSGTLPITLASIPWC